MAKGQKLTLMKHSYDLLAQLAQLLQCATDEAKVMGVRAVIGSRVIMTMKGFDKCSPIWSSQHPCRSLEQALFILLLYEKINRFKKVK